MISFRNKKSKRTTRKKRISGRWAFTLVWLRRFGLSLAALTALLWIGTWVWLSGLGAQAQEWAKTTTLAATQEMGLSVENIMVEGRVNTNASVLLGLINIEKGDALLSFDPMAAKILIERITWVETARVERRFPDTIYVNIIERMPLALFHDGNTLVLLDQKGKAITDHNLERFKNLLVLSGKGAAQNALEFMALLQAEPDILPLVQSAGWISERRWDLKLKNGITIQLPEQDAGFALHRMVHAHKKDGVLDKNIKGIDMREPDRIIIQTRPGAVQEYKVNFNVNSKQPSSSI